MTEIGLTRRSDRNEFRSFLGQSSVIGWNESDLSLPRWDMDCWELERLLRVGLILWIFIIDSLYSCWIFDYVCTYLNCTLFGMMLRSQGVMRLKIGDRE